MSGHRAIAMIVAASLAVGTAHGGEVIGTLRNASQAGPVAEHDVRLTASLEGGERLDQTATTDADGGYGFADVPADTSIIYVVSVNFHGVEYVSRFFRFAPGAETLETEIEVYDVTDDPSSITLSGHHYVIEIPVGSPRVAVTEVLAIENTGVTTFSGHTPLALPLPDAAQEVEPLEGLQGAFVRDGAIHLSTPLRPGRNEGAFRYLLPAASPLEFVGQQALPTDIITLLVAPVSASVSGERLAAMGPVDLGGGVICQRYGIEVPPPGSAFRVTIAGAGSGAGAGAGSLAWVLVGSLLAVFAAVLVWRERPPATAASSAEVRRLSAERDRRLQDVLDLETRLRDGDITTGEFRTQRDALLTQAATVQELLDAAQDSVA